MNSDEIIIFLEKYNYKYTVKQNLITVNLEFSQNVIIDLSSPGKLKISDQLVSWNFLTGVITMSLKNAFVYNFVLTVFFGFFCQYAEVLNHNLTNIYLTFISWILIFIIFYLIKLESFKLQLIAATK
ncbi:hypothetical protein D0809_01535 [Flavobacterium circumlabens]|uniref:Uncharacterized protein n=1 Tax=Flavobacterium circumlabens TaxID=2133765 RepID=A0A4Y7UH72_9FLAO|nr:hypothetical protein EV142_101128 [Flavobacterium circumlabens]TEB45716.1 hypothetical protein D0809_01535 [Flavobacterium circumlabens]